MGVSDIFDARINFAGCWGLLSHGARGIDSLHFHLMVRSHALHLQLVLLNQQLSLPIVLPLRGPPILQSLARATQSACSSLRMRSRDEPNSYGDQKRF